MGEIDRMTTSEGLNWFLEWYDEIQATGDNTLVEKFQIFMDIDSFSDQAFEDFFRSLLESTNKILEE